tara:strand:- start:2492 stop:3667 length:1176 start_codon:yes stop_codon:yes gene_type:complete
MNKNLITVVGSGYVGMSLSVLLAQNNIVTVLDIDEERVNKINNNQSTIVDEHIENYLEKKDLSISATNDQNQAFYKAEFIIVATPTNYDEETGHFDTTSVDKVVESALEKNTNALIIIKSTIPVGHTKTLQSKFNTSRIIFSPEFLREGKALIDNLFPSRIIVGGNCELSNRFAKILLDASEKKDVEIIFSRSTEAEAIKLFANTYLAMRVAFFNELDSYSMVHELDTKDIIEGIGLDARIGKGYNNPSFGYGGYCLPKDTKQMLSNFKDVPQNIIQAIVESNLTRKKFISDQIIKKNPKVVGFYRLIMKSNSDNFRSSAIQGIMENIISSGIPIIIYEPSLKSELFFDSEVINDITEFKKRSDVIVANRKSSELLDVSKKLFSRDIFGDN